MEPQISETKESEKTESVQSKDNVFPENPQERNWKAFREQKEKERKQRLAAEKIAAEEKAKAQALQAALESALNKNNHSHQNNSSEDLSEDDRIQKKVDAALEAREKQYEINRLNKEKSEMPERLISEHKDFESVVTEENLDYLQYHYPEVAEPYKNLPDNFNKWAGLYKAIKRFVPNADSKKDMGKADRNMNKPQSISVPGVAPTGDEAPRFLDEKRRAENWIRMQRTMKGG